MEGEGGRQESGGEGKRGEEIAGGGEGRGGEGRGRRGEGEKSMYVDVRIRRDRKERVERTRARHNRRS